MRPTAAAGANRRLDNDYPKNFLGHVTRDLVSGVRLGVLGYRGQMEGAVVARHQAILGAYRVLAEQSELSANVALLQHAVGELGQGAALFVRGSAARGHRRGRLLGPAATARPRDPFAETSWSGRIRACA